MDVNFWLTATNPGTPGELAFTPTNVISSGGIPNTNVDGMLFNNVFINTPSLFQQRFIAFLSTPMQVNITVPNTTYYIVGFGKAATGQNTSIVVDNGTSSQTGWRAVKVK